MTLVKTKAKNINPKSINTSVPWSAAWMRIHFHYLDPIQDDFTLTKKEKIQDRDVHQRVQAFAAQRKNYRYQLVANNTRDLGGYYTKDGHQIRRRLLLRSDNLHHLDYFGGKVLQRLHLQNDIDLRSLAEIKNAPDLVNKQYVRHEPVYTQKGVNRSRNKTFQYGVIYRYGTLFLTNPHAQAAYRNSFAIIAHAKGSSLFHCTEGRDRTGLLAVLLLVALGVDKQTIINDYLLTDYYAHTKPYIKQLEQINHFYHQAHLLYGNVWDYILHIGIPYNEIILLRKKYLK